MERRPIGYLGLCEQLLNEGVPVDGIKIHRFLLEALASQMYANPTDIDYDRGYFSFRIVGRGRSVVLLMSRLSSQALWTRYVHDPKDPFTSYDQGTCRASMLNAPEMMLWVFPIESQFTWWERFLVWIEKKWLRIKRQCKRITTNS